MTRLGRRLAPKSGEKAAWRRDPDAKRGNIIGAARTLFREKGYLAASTSEIARRAGTSEGLVFHYFGSKEGLLAQVANDYASRFSAAMFAGMPDDAHPSVPMIIRNIFAFVGREGPLISLVAATGGTSAWPIHREIVLASMIRRFKRWRSEGLIRDMDCDIGAELVFGLVAAAITHCFVSPKQRNKDRWIRETVTSVQGVLAICARCRRAGPS